MDLRYLCHNGKKLSFAAHTEGGAFHSMGINQCWTVGHFKSLNI